MRFRGLDLNLLVTLEVLLVECNLTRAAERLNLGQPAVSNALAKLREHFDDELLTRQGREMMRTVFAQQLIKPLQDTLQHIKGVAMARPGFDPSTAALTYKIVASDFISIVLLGPLILQVERAAPHVRIEILPLTDDSIGKFSRGEADAVIRPAGRIFVPSTEQRDLFTENFICIAARSNTGVGEEISAEEFHTLKRAVPPYKTYWPTAGIVSDALGIAVPMPFSAIPWFVARSDYVAVVPERLAALYEPVLELKRIRLSTPFPSVIFVAQSHSDALGDPFKLWMLDQMAQAAK
jgi:LysR family nod box-dependent transcriptional activator